MARRHECAGVAPDGTVAVLRSDVHVPIRPAVVVEER